MPLNIPDKLPAFDILQKEKIFVMEETQAIHQDIRPLKVIILNLMHIDRIVSSQPVFIFMNQNVL